MKETTLEEYQRRFDLDGEGGDLLSELAGATAEWVKAHPEGAEVRRMLEQWLWLTGFAKCPCSACKARRGEPLTDYDREDGARIEALGHRFTSAGKVG